MSSTTTITVAPADKQTSGASPRDVWEKQISVLLDQANQHKEPYKAQFGPHNITIHPTVYSPAYFPETWWYGTHLPAIVNKGSWLEIGVGSGLVSLCIASAGSKTVSGVDINPNAVEFTAKNLEANGLKGNFAVSDIFEKVEGKFDFIFWNHPWQYDSSIPDQLKSEKTHDSEYKLLRRFVAEAKEYLTEKGVILLGTSAYANLDAIKTIAQSNGYNHKELLRGQEPIGNDVVEEYYVIELSK
ncbi:hypothetical protein PspLS_09708 [Pyricularia sp. CBS 133598]|nr:hypothetical protein PspLS_09708 [Pyricularia sp. CBS 133598]